MDRVKIRVYGVLKKKILLLNLVALKHKCTYTYYSNLRRSRAFNLNFVNLWCGFQFKGSWPLIVIHSELTARKLVFAR